MLYQVNKSSIRHKLATSQISAGTPAGNVMDLLVKERSGLGIYNTEIFSNMSLC